MTNYFLEHAVKFNDNLSGKTTLLNSLYFFNDDTILYLVIILDVVLCGCETWSLTLREERKMRVFENMVLKRIFGPKRDKVTGEWRRLHNEELNDLYSSTNIMRVITSRKNDMGWACGAYG